MAKKPDDIARDLGLDFTCAPRVVAGKTWLNFHFNMPMGSALKASASDSKPFNQAKLDTQAAKKMAEEDAKSGVHERIAALTRWRQRCEAWIVNPAPIGETGTIVAGELTLGNRLQVGLMNRRNKKAMEKFHSADAQARRVAMMQDTPQAALKALDDTLKLYRVTKPDNDTLRLRKTLEESATVVAKDDPKAAAELVRKGAASAAKTTSVKTDGPRTYQ